MIRAKCARMLGDGEAGADVAQETFARLCASPVAHEPPAARLRWIYQTSTHLAIDQLRRRRLGVEVRPAAPFDAPRVEAPVDATLSARPSLQRLAAALSPVELEVVILARCDRLGQREIAELAGVSSRSVRRILARVDERLAILARSLS